MRRKALLLGALVAAVVAGGLGAIAWGMTGGATGTTQQAYAPHINPSGFTNLIPEAEGVNEAENSGAKGPGALIKPFSCPNFRDLREGEVLRISLMRVSVK
jgi:hypothetical protein